MKAKKLPTAPITSADSLYSMFKNDKDLPATKEEAQVVLERAPKAWRGKELVFPRVYSRGANTPGGSQMEPSKILMAWWDKSDKQWKFSSLTTEYHRGVAPDFVNVNSIIPQRVQ